MAGDAQIFAPRNKDGYGGGDEFKKLWNEYRTRFGIEFSAKYIQANSLLNAPAPKTLTGLRGRAILALLLGCGLRLAELLRINFEDLQQRQGRCVLPDMVGKGNRVRTVIVPAGVKTRIDAWLKASGVTEGRPFRPVSKAGELAGTEIRDEKAVWRLVMRYARRLTSASSRRTICVGRARSFAGRRAETWNRYSFCLSTPRSRRPNAIWVPNKRWLMR
jgi:integrase